MGYRLFVEGDSDVCFLTQYLMQILSNDVISNYQIDFRKTGGWTNVRNNLPAFQEVTDAGGKNLLIFDADFPETGGGFETRYHTLIEEKVKLHIEFELFLFPNNGTDGTLEHLLEGIVPVKHQPVLKCFDGFQTCLTHLKEGDTSLRYNTPIQKSKIYSYIDTVADKNEFEKVRKGNKHNMCYNNPAYWDYSSEKIKALELFFKKHLL